MNPQFTKPYEQMLNTLLTQLSINPNLSDEKVDSTATFYYIGIGTANYRNEYPDPDNQHEYPPFVQNSRYGKKVLILIDPSPNAPPPLYGSEHVLTNKFADQKYSYYESVDQSENNSENNTDLEIHNIRELFNIDKSYYLDNPEYVAQTDFCIQFLHDLIDIILSSNPMNLLLVANFTGLNWYHLQDQIINEFEPERHNDIRQRFLIDSRYYNNPGCFYPLTDINNQPIIEDGQFYNPGNLTIHEFDAEIVKLFTSVEHDSQIFRMKKTVITNIFNNLLRQTFNEEYRKHRVAYSETADPDIKKIQRMHMLEYVKKMLNALRSFVDIDRIYEQMIGANIYSDESTIRQIFMDFIQI